MFLWRFRPRGRSLSEIVKGGRSFAALQSVANDRHVGVQPAIVPERRLRRTAVGIGVARLIENSRQGARVPGGVGGRHGPKDALALIVIVRCYRFRSSMFMEGRRLRTRFSRTTRPWPGETQIRGPQSTATRLRNDLFSANFRSSSQSPPLTQNAVEKSADRLRFIQFCIVPFVRTFVRSRANQTGQKIAVFEIISVHD
jgi:hypothetical protein